MIYRDREAFVAKFMPILYEKISYALDTALFEEMCRFRSEKGQKSSIW